MAKSDNWQTPPDLMQVLNQRYKFTTEVAAAADNRALPGLPYLGLDNGLDALDPNNPWGEMNYCNPPYSKIGPFVEAAERQARYCQSTLLLIPAYTDTKYWQGIIDYAAQDVELLRGRLRFWDNGKPGKDTARFPSATVLFTPYGIYMGHPNYRCWDWKRWKWADQGLTKT